MWAGAFHTTCLCISSEQNNRIFKDKQKEVGVYGIGFSELSFFGLSNELHHGYSFDMFLLQIDSLFLP